MFRKYDYVRIVDYPERQKGDLEQLIGKEAMIIDIDRKYNYPYEVCFFDKEAQDLSLWNGNLLFNDNHLELVDGQDIAGAKRELRRLIDSLKYPVKVDKYKIIEELKKIERML